MKNQIKVLLTAFIALLFYSNSFAQKTIVEKYGQLSVKGSYMVSQQRQLFNSSSRSRTGKQKEPGQERTATQLSLILLSTHLMSATPRSVPVHCTPGTPGSPRPFGARTGHLLRSTTPCATPDRLP